MGIKEWLLDSLVDDSEDYWKSYDTLKIRCVSITCSLVAVLLKLLFCLLPRFFSQAAISHY